MHLIFLQMSNRAFSLEIVALLLNSPEREVDGKYILIIAYLYMEYFLIILCNISYTYTCIKNQRLTHKIFCHAMKMKMMSSS